MQSLIPFLSYHSKRPKIVLKGNFPKIPPFLYCNCKRRPFEKILLCYRIKHSGSNNWQFLKKMDWPNKNKEKNLLTQNNKKGNWINPEFITGYRVSHIELVFLEASCNQTIVHTDILWWFLYSQHHNILILYSMLAFNKNRPFDPNFNFK